MSGAERKGLKCRELRIKASEIVRILFHKPDPSLGINRCGHHPITCIGRLPGCNASRLWIETSEKVACHFPDPNMALRVPSWLHETDVRREGIEVDVPDTCGDDRRGFWRPIRRRAVCCL